MRLQGRRRIGRAEAIEDREAALAAAERLVAGCGAKGVGGRRGLAFDAEAPPSREELAAAMEGHVVIQPGLDP